MKITGKIKLALVFESLLLLGIVTGIYLFEADMAEAYGLFEVLGAILATIMTTYGLYEMRKIT